MTAKFHFIRHRPTVLDDFPLDVIRVHIFPCLDYESRININQCLPPWDRIQTKMNPLAIRKHDNGVRRAHINEILFKTTMLASSHPHRNTDTAVAKNLAKVLELHFNPMYFSYIQDSEIYRKGLLTNMDRILEGTPVAPPRSLSITQNDLILTTKRLIEKIAESGPYGPTVDYKSVEELSFV